MDQDGIEAFFKDVGVDAEKDIVVILVAQYCEAQSMGEFSKAEFIKGSTVLGCDNTNAWKDVIRNRLRKELQNEAMFGKLYKYTHAFATEKGFKNVDKETACALWQLFLGDRCPFLGKWEKFLLEEKSDLKVITKDNWELFYDLVKQTKGDLNNFVDDGAWPSLFDEFIMYTQK